MTREATRSDGGRPADSAAAGDRLRAWVRADFGVELVSIEATGYGADETVELWRAVNADGAAFAVKLSGGGSAAGLAVSAHLAQQQVAGVVGPVATRDGRLCSVRQDRRLSVVPWVSDGRAVDGAMSAAHWVSYGALLADVHATVVADPLARVLPSENYTHDWITATVQAVDRQVRAGAGQPGRQGHLADPLTRAVADLWSAAASSVAALVASANDLGQQLATRPALAVVCHGDPHLGNVLLGAGERVWLIDWDDAVLAPPERDLMFVIGGVLAFAPVTPQQQAWFFDGYGPAELDPARLAYYQCTRALEDVAGPAAQILDPGRYTENDRAEALEIVEGVLSPAGLVTFALSALRDLGRGPDSPATGPAEPT